jgi:hypothetical protein
MPFFHTTKVQQFSDMTKLFLLKISKNTKKREGDHSSSLFTSQDMREDFIKTKISYYNYINRIKALLVYSYLYF